MRLILVRHGETVWNRDGMVQGQSDPELSDRGKEQAERLALALKDEKVEAIYTSPLRRALDTAEAIARYHSTIAQVEGDLIELDCGEMDGLTYPEMRERFGDFLKEWARDAAPLKLPGGECLQELQDRAWPVIERIRDSHNDAVAVVVSHNFAIASIICKAIGMRLSDFRRIRLGVASISIIDFTERGTVLTLLNDTCHLRPKADS